MYNTLVINLEEVRKYRNSKEYHYETVATVVALGETFVRTGYGYHVQNLCKDLMSFSPDLGDSLVKVTRGTKLVFKPAKVKDFASGRHYRSDNQPEQLKRKKSS